MDKEKSSNYFRQRIKIKIENPDVRKNIEKKMEEYRKIRAIRAILEGAGMKGLEYGIQKRIEDRLIFIEIYVARILNEEHIDEPCEEIFKMLNSEDVNNYPWTDRELMGLYLEIAKETKEEDKYKDEL